MLVDMSALDLGRVVLIGPAIQAPHGRERTQTYRPSAVPIAVTSCGQHSSNFAIDIQGQEFDHFHARPVRHLSVNDAFTAPAPSLGRFVAEITTPLSEYFLANAVNAHACQMPLSGKH